MLRRLTLYVDLPSSPGDVTVLKMTAAGSTPGTANRNYVVRIYNLCCFMVQTPPSDSTQMGTICNIHDDLLRHLSPPKE